MIYNFIFKIMKYYKLLLLVSLLAIIILSVLEETISFLITYIFILIISSAIISFFKEKKIIKILFFAILSISTIFTSLVFTEYKYSVGKIYMGEDDKYFDMDSRLVASRYNFNLFEAKSYFFRIGHTDASKWYTSFVVQIYTIMNYFSLDTHTMVPRLLNSFFLGFTGLIIYLIGGAIGLRFENKITAALLSGIWPVILWHSAAVRRDTIVLLFIMGLVFGLMKLLKNPPYLLQNILITLLSFSIVFALRPSFAIIVVVAFCFYYIISRVNSQSIQLLLISTLLILSVYPILFLVRIFSSEYMGLLEGLLSYGIFRTSEVGQGLSKIIFSQPLVLQIPLKLMYASILPLPLPTLELITKNIRWMGTIFWIMNLPFLLNAIIYNYRFSREFRFIIMIFMVLFIAINLSTFTETHQMLYYPLGIIIIFYQRNTLGILLPKYKSRYELLMRIALLSGVFIYIILKIIL
jgi:hypothetical protein